MNNPLDANTALVRLNELLDKIEELKNYGTDEYCHFQSWRDAILKLLARQLGTSSSQYQQFAAIDFTRAKEELLFQTNKGVKFSKAIASAEALLVGVKTAWEKRNMMPNMTEQRVKIFISHSSNDDSDIANEFRNWLISTYSIRPEEVFVSSSPDSLGGQDFYVSQISHALRSASVVIVLLTKQSVEKPWVLFEAGAGFKDERLLSPILCKGMTVLDIPLKSPFMQLQAKTAVDKPQFSATLQMLDEMLGVEADRRKDDGETLRRKLVANPKLKN